MFNKNSKIFLRLEWGIKKHMRKKLIKTNEGLFEMGVDELLPMFDNILKKFSHMCVRGLKKYNQNTCEFEDFYQIGVVELMTAFDKYDHTKGATFFTHLHRELHHRFIMIIREFEADKRKVEQPVVYLDKEVDEGCEISNVIGKCDKYFSENKLEKLLRENLTDTERVLIAVHFKKNIYKTKGIYKESLDYAIRTLLEENFFNLNASSLNKTKLSELLGISRPTLNKRTDEALKKAKRIAKYYIENERLNHRL